MFRREHLQDRQREARRIEAGNAVLQDKDRLLRLLAAQDHRCRDQDRVDAHPPEQRADQLTRQDLAVQVADIHEGKQDAYRHL